ncbi:hypothetical protein H4217_008353 [Coemansia sp. RSA 1939]|nr:hypothetical protein H4217_008353 [Coemansia sp. RSA 1939]
MSNVSVLQDSTYELLRGLANLSSAVENDPLYFDQLLGAAVNVKHAFDLGRMDVINGIIRPRNTSLCHECITTVSSVWRSGPEGPRTLCNACGLRYYKQNQRRALEVKRRELREAADSLASLNPANGGSAEKKPLPMSVKGKKLAGIHPVDTPSSAALLSSSLPNIRGNVLECEGSYYDEKTPNPFGGTNDYESDEDDDAEDDDEADCNPTYPVSFGPQMLLHHSRSNDHIRSSPELTRPSISNLCDIQPPAPEKDEGRWSGQNVGYALAESYLSQKDDCQFIPSIKNILASASSTTTAPSAFPLPPSLPGTGAPSSFHSHVDNHSYYYSGNNNNSSSSNPVAEIQHQEQRLYTGSGETR